MNITFITGNQGKADYLAQLLGMPIEHQKVELDEIQALDLETIVEHKVKQAYEIIKSPVLVEDTSLEFTALGRLPGPFIKWFEGEMSLEEICRLLDGNDRSCTARAMFGFYDGTTEKYFAGANKGTVAEHPQGETGYGWDPIVIPEGYAVTRAELTQAENEAVYLKTKPIEQVREFLQTLN